MCGSLGFSIRMLGIENGVFTRPMPSSNGSSCFGSGAKIEPIVGAQERCSHATGMPLSSSPASIRSAEMVW